MVSPRSTCDIIGVLIHHDYFSFLLFRGMFYSLISSNAHSVTMQAQKEFPPDMQCKDKFLLQSVIATHGASVKDITPEMVMSSESYASVAPLWLLLCCKLTLLVCFASFSLARRQDM